MAPASRPFTSRAAKNRTRSGVAGGPGRPQREHEWQAAAALRQARVVRQAPPAVGAPLHPREEPPREEGVLLEGLDAEPGAGERVDEIRDRVQPDVLDARDRLLRRAVAARVLLADGLPSVEVRVEEPQGRLGHTIVEDVEQGMRLDDVEDAARRP